MYIDTYIWACIYVYVCELSPPLYGEVRYTRRYVGYKKEENKTTSIYSQQNNKYIQPVLLKNPLVHGVLHMLLLDTGNPLLGLDTGVRGTDVFLLEEPLHDPLLLRSVPGTLSCRLLRSVQRLLRSVQGKCSWPASSVPSRFERHPVLGDLPVAAVSLFAQRQDFLREVCISNPAREYLISLLCLGRATPRWLAHITF